MAQEARNVGDQSYSWLAKLTECRKSMLRLHPKTTPFFSRQLLVRSDFLWCFLVYTVHLSLFSRSFHIIWRVSRRVRVAGQSCDSGHGTNIGPATAWLTTGELVVHEHPGILGAHRRRGAWSELRLCVFLLFSSPSQCHRTDSPGGRDILPFSTSPHPYL